jgi:hypothetical protein
MSSGKRRFSGKRSATYSTMARLAQMIRSPSDRIGTTSDTPNLRHPALELELLVETVKAQLDVLKGDLEMAHDDPYAHEPGRVVLVADVEFHVVGDPASGHNG